MVAKMCLAFGGSIPTPKHEGNQSSQGTEFSGFAESLEDFSITVLTLKTHPTHAQRENVLVAKLCLVSLGSTLSSKLKSDQTSQRTEISEIRATKISVYFCR